MKIKASKFAKFIFDRFVIGSGRLLAALEVAYKHFLLVVVETRHPQTALFMEVDSSVTGLCYSSYLSGQISTLGTWAEVASSVVERVVVFMINCISVGLGYLSVKKSELSVHVPDCVKHLLPVEASSGPRGTPFPLTQMIVESGINYGIHALSEREITTGIVLYSEFLFNLRRPWERARSALRGAFEFPVVTVWTAIIMSVRFSPVVDFSHAGIVNVGGTQFK